MGVFSARFSGIVGQEESETGNFRDRRHVLDGLARVVSRHDRAEQARRSLDLTTMSRSSLTGGRDQLSCDSTVCSDLSEARWVVFSVLIPRFPLRE